MGYVAMSFLEYWFHKFHMHQPGFMNSINPNMFEHHQLIHHPAYRKDFEASNPVEDKDVGTELRIWLSAVVAAPFLALFGYFVSWTGGITLWCGLILHHWLWNVLHTHMHQKDQPWKKFTVYRFFYNHHLMHHWYPRNNYNVVCILADFIMGSYRKPTVEEQAKMDELHRQ